MARTAQQAEKQIYSKKSCNLKISHFGAAVLRYREPQFLEGVTVARTTLSFQEQKKRQARRDEEGNGGVSVPSGGAGVGAVSGAQVSALRLPRKPTVRPLLGSVLMGSVLS